jgi:hypothetical protein
MGCITALGIIAALGVLNHFMFFTRRTILRVFGWTAIFFTVAFIFVFAALESRPSYSGVNASDIVNDLRNLRGAALMFFADFEEWPLPGQEASLDAYCDRPIVLTKHPRYARVMVAVDDESGDAGGQSTHYIGVELTPPNREADSRQKKLALDATHFGLFQSPRAGDIYKSGLNVYMRMY